MQLVIFLATVVILDAGLGRLLDHFYFKQTSGLQYRTTNAMEKTTADVLIFGSSRANHHYQPDVFASEMNRTYYNAGRDGNFIFFHYAVLQAVLKRYRPKVIILDFMAGEFARNQTSYDRISSLLPYYKRHPEIRPLINLKSPYEKFKLWSGIYPFNSALFTIAAGNSGFNKTRLKENKGYVPLTNVMLPQPARQDPGLLTYEPDSNKVKFFELFLADCRRNEVELYIVCSPYFDQTIERDYSVTRARELARKYNVPFLDHSNDTAFFNHSALFADRLHLNDMGARKFTHSVIAEILWCEQHPGKPLQDGVRAPAQISRKSPSATLGQIH